MEIFALEKLPVGKVVGIFSVFYDRGSKDNIKMDVKIISYGVDLSGS
jgi:hypothetical protein